MLEKENFIFRKRGIMAKRKGYATPEQQAQANKRYYANEDAVLKRKVRNCKSNGKSFILNFAGEDDLKEYEGYIKERRKDLEEGN